MADIKLQPITRGMDNGAETINNNFNTLQTAVSGGGGGSTANDTGWLNCTINSGYGGTMQARYVNGMIFHSGYISSTYNPTSEVTMRNQAFTYPAEIAQHVKGEGQYDRPFYIPSADNSTYISGYIKGGTQVGGWVWKQKGAGQWGFSSIVVPALN